MEDERYAPDSDIHDLTNAPKKPRIIPNILVTGVPGTGKTTLSKLLAEQLNISLNQAINTVNKNYYEYINCGEIIQNNKLWQGWDEKMNCSILDDDKVVDFLENDISQGGKILDFHSCDFFPERWFDLIILLRIDNKILRERLKERGYSDDKIMNNSKWRIIFFEKVLIFDS